MSDNDELLQDEDQDQTSIVRLMTGEYVIGVIDEGLSEVFGMMTMLNPCLINFIEDATKVRISHYNRLSRGDYVIFTDNAIMQFESPSTPLLKQYIEFVTGEKAPEPQYLTEDDEGEEAPKKEKRVLH